MYQPTHPTPYLETIDAAAEGGNIFKCLLNPRDYVKEYILTISETNASTTVVIKGYISSGTQKKTIDDVEVDVNPADTILPAKGTADDDGWLQVYVPNNLSKFANKKNYTWTLKLINSSTNYIETPEYYFSTCAAQRISIGDIPSPVTSNHIKRTVTDTSNTIISSQKFILYNSGEIVDETEEMFSVSPVYEYDGLMSGETYTLEWVIKDRYGRTVSDSKTFDVKYQNRQSSVYPVAAYNAETACVDIDYSKNGVIEGVADKSDDIEFKKYLSDGKVPDTTNGISLKKDNSIYWNKVNDRYLNLDDVYYALNWHGHQGFSGKIFEIIDEEYPLKNIVVGYSDNSFYYKIGTLPEVLCPIYTNTEAGKAVAGADDYSVAATVASVSTSSKSITLSSADGISVNMVLCLDGDIYKVTAVSGKTVTVDETPSSGIVNTNVVFYNEDVFYNLTEDMTLNKTDILFDNELVFNYWWNIFINGETCKFVRGAEYSKTEVTQ